jgi:hypothetical protein
MRNSVGFVRTPRTADAIAMSIWPSRGLEIYGFEIKVSRADWLQELKNPKKAEGIGRFCDRWYVVVPKKDMVDLTEMPPAWGLLVLHGKTVRQVKAAELLKAEQPDRLFVAAIMRRLKEWMDAHRGEWIKRADIDAEFQAVAEYAEEQAKTRETYLTKEIQDLRKTIQQFEDLAGIRLTKWGYGNISDCVAAIRRYGISTIDRAIQQLMVKDDIELLRKRSCEIEKLIAELSRATLALRNLIEPKKEETNEGDT